MYVYVCVRFETMPNKKFILNFVMPQIIILRFKITFLVWMYIQIPFSNKYIPTMYMFTHTPCTGDILEFDFVKLTLFNSPSN